MVTWMGANSKSTAVPFFSTEWSLWIWHKLDFMNSITIDVGFFSLYWLWCYRLVAILKYLAHLGPPKNLNDREREEFHNFFPWDIFLDFPNWFNCIIYKCHIFILISLWFRANFFNFCCSFFCLLLYSWLPIISFCIYHVIECIFVLKIKLLWYL